VIRFGRKNEDARYLFDALVAPAASTLRKGARIVLISDGSLDELNFETLLVPGNDGLHYWIEDVTIVNTNAIRSTSGLDSQNTGTTGNGMLLIGDPISPGSDYPRLMNAEAEIHSIEKHFRPDNEVVLTRANAVPAAYTAGQPDHFSYIHFVAHGTASRLSPLDSASCFPHPKVIRTRSSCTQERLCSNPYTPDWSPFRLVMGRASARTRGKDLWDCPGVPACWGA